MEIKVEKTRNGMREAWQGVPDKWITEKQGVAQTLK